MRIEMHGSAWVLALLVVSGAPGLAQDVAGTSPVYPEAGEALRFDHTRHRDLACEHCHPEQDQRIRPGSGPVAGHAVCSACHPGVSAESDDPGPTCTDCHRGQPGGRTRRPAVLKFSHVLHASAGQSCPGCHSTSAGSPRAGFESCQDCHAGWLDSGRCDACHPARADGRLLTDLEGGALIPVGGHGGDDHRGAWDRGHGRVARARSNRCQVCHARDSCDRCHRGVRKPMRQHPADWELSHAGLARADAHSCRKCHRSQSDCLGCHSQVGVDQASQARPGGIRLHPEGFGDGSVHGPAARRNLVSCTGCHLEGDCIQCHGATGMGGGISPHPAGFKRRCRLLRDRNPRPCVKCHRPDDLERLCP